MFKLTAMKISRDFLNKTLIFCFLILVVSCEELSDNLSPRDSIIDTWKCTETDSDKIVDSFLVEIVEDEQSLTGVKIYNFNHLGESFAVKANISSLSVSIPSQKSEGFTISGSGAIMGDYEEITLSYSVNDGGGVEKYTAVLTKP